METNMNKKTILLAALFFLIIGVLGLKCPAEAEAKSKTKDCLLCSSSICHVATTLENDKHNIDDLDDLDDLDDMDDCENCNNIQGKNPAFVFPRHPEMRKLHFKALELAEEYAKILSERSQLQPELGSLEKDEARLRYLMLKYRFEYMREKDRLINEKGLENAEKMLKNHKERLMIIDQLIAAEEKIDCLHTIYEKKHRALEEYHWSMLDGKHPLIDEYLQGLIWEKHKEEYETLYNEIYEDYQKMIADNKEMLKRTKINIEEKKERIVLLNRIVNILTELCKEMENL